jgi:CRISPR-associated endonuclease/helicase Cas3
MKSSPAYRTDEFLSQNIRDAGISLKSHSEYKGRSETRHAIISHKIMIDNGFDESISVIAGAHHGKPPMRGQVRRLKGYPGNCAFDDETWNAVREELLDYALSLAGLKKEDAIRLTVKKTAQILLSAIVILSDWIASDEKLFPLIDIESVQCTNDPQARAKHAWDSLKLTPFWETVQDWDGLFQRRFEITPRPLQETLLEIVKICLKPGIVIVEAPMGEGKTEAALAAAEVMAHFAGRGGVFFALPTQATSDAMFMRVLDWIGNIDTSMDAHSVLLAHGKSDFNEAYRKIRLSDNTNVGYAEEGDAGNVIVHEWLSGRKKGLLADFVIGTIDQLLLAGLKQKHLMLRHLGLANKVVIIDECHAYDTYMSQYLFKAIAWLGAYGTPVIVLSATLPAEKRRQVINAYMNKNKAEKFYHDPVFDGPKKEKNEPETPKWVASLEYPLITYTDGEEIKQETATGAKRRIDVSIRSLNEEKIADALEEALSDGGCAGVVVNTVKRAQKLFEIIAKRFGAENVCLLHSRFIAPDRAKKENALREMLGPDNEKRPEKLIVIGTQVLEQSLDLDFDLLITDLCPMDLLIQRIGRLHRHIRHRPKKLRHAVCYVMGVEGEGFDPGSEKIYGAYLLMRTKALLPEEIILPDSIPNLVQDTYNEKKTQDSRIASKLPASYETAQKQECARNEKQKSRAENFQIAAPPSDDSTDTMIGWLDTDVTDGHGEAAVRDGADSIEVIVIQRNENSLRLLPWIGRGREIPRHAIPEDGLARMIASCRLRLPSEFDAEWRIDETIKKLEEICAKEHLEEWQKSGWLKGELFLILNEDRKTALCGYQLTYDQHMGLISEKLEV